MKRKRIGIGTSYWDTMTQTVATGDKVNTAAAWRKMRLAYLNAIKHSGSNAVTYEVIGTVMCTFADIYILIDNNSQRVVTDSIISNRPTYAQKVFSFQKRDVPNVPIIDDSYVVQLAKETADFNYNVSDYVEYENFTNDSVLHMGILTEDAAYIIKTKKPHLIPLLEENKYRVLYSPKQYKWWNSIKELFPTVIPTDSEAEEIIESIPIPKIDKGVSLKSILPALAVLGAVQILQD